MKIKSLFILAVLGFGMSLSASELTVVSTEKLDVGGTAFHPVLSPDGNTLLFSSEEHKGLKSLNLVTKEVSVIDENAGAGFTPVFSADGKEVVYRTVSYQGKLLYRDVRKYNIETSKVVQLAKPCREVVNTQAIVGDTYAVGHASRQFIDVTIKGKTNEVNPLPDGHLYVWSALSPSNDKLLFFEMNSGLFVSNADGSGAKKLDVRADYPCWAGDDYIVALSTKDDGYVITSAKIVAIDIATGKVIELTGDDVLAEGVTATKDKIAYTTESGEMYIMNIKVAK
ncbi:MAG: PD40 domain-containing protein [Muribaculaceae bacterium]|nr:PD40 domain-containing protein [Muribaculaceae bacterium]